MAKLKLVVSGYARKSSHALIFNDYLSETKHATIIVYVCIITQHE